MVDGEVKLLEHVKVIFGKADFEEGYSNDKRFDEFKKYQSFYYFVATTPTPQKLKSTLAAVSKTFPHHNSEIIHYINTQSLDCRNEQILIKILNYYYSIK